MTRQIVISEEVYKELMSLKVHPREPFNDVIKRLLAFYRAQQERIGNSGGEIGEPQKDTEQTSKEGINQPSEINEGEEKMPKGIVVEKAEPQFPKTEVPLTGIPTRETPKEPPVNFSWATRGEKSEDVIVKLVAHFKKWDTRKLVDAFKRCRRDDPAKKAIIGILRERFNAETWPMDEKAMIRDFFRDEEVKKFMEEHGIEEIKESVPAGEKPAGEQKEEEKEGG